MNVSVLTLVHNRNAALRNTLAGLAAGTVLPAEVIVMHLNEEPVPLPGMPFPVHQLTLYTGDSLNLAMARNRAMSCSSSDLNIFLDVDCIPALNLIERYLDCFATADDVLWSGKVRYLPEGATGSDNWLQRMHELSKPDPVRDGHDHYPYEWFWSLNFACSAAVFEKIGGFDAAFKGYGAEDTDFAFAARKNRVPLQVAAATAYHQHHSSCSPPLNHFSAIIENARVFNEKWQEWPMPGWLQAFVQLGLIRLQGNALEVLRHPTEAEITQARK
ncbi:hypothetical protein C7T94_04170 [Pedobacter yulinensis]|uniref:Galactosyltransferase C-terminal domain-containing protein n=1 Tax=Pedobacter yulinensis TaxID=2126353 RepID=A0A2T3HNG2_9SPHI|nr:galactosyltransferase-related protein [Pedobacter yulinensis]PST83947.1 hypothetical protein C7T94_04170 [Pedobacter yulinensis]